MDEKNGKEIILFDDSNSYSFCYFYSGVFDQKDLELKLSELYNKKFGENAKFSYKITQKTGNNTWFASIGCNGKDIVPNKTNFPFSYFVASIISKKYKDEYIYVIVEESSSFTVFLCYNEPIYSSKIGNKLLAISSGIGKEISKMSETYSNASGKKLEVDKIIFYGSLSQEQINLVSVPGINKKIKEDELDYSLFDSPLNLSASRHFVDSATLIEKNKQSVQAPVTSKIESKEESEEEVEAEIDNKRPNSSLNFAAGPDVEILESPSKIKPIKVKTGNLEFGKLISNILVALIIGATFFPLINLSIKSMDFYTTKINSNIEELKSSSISELPDSVLTEIKDKTLYLNSLAEIKDYNSDIVDNKIDKILFRDPLVSVKNFSVVNGVYDIKIEVNSEKDFLNYLSNLLFSNKFILSESPSEILPEKSYEIKVIPIPFS